jgi:hypothetical protein
VQVHCKETRTTTLRLGRSWARSSPKIQSEKALSVQGENSGRHNIELSRPAVSPAAKPSHRFEPVPGEPEMHLRGRLQRLVMRRHMQPTATPTVFPLSISQHAFPCSRSPHLVPTGPMYRQSAVLCIDPDTSDPSRRVSIAYQPAQGFPYRQRTVSKPNILEGQIMQSFSRPGSGPHFLFGPGTTEQQADPSSPSNSIQANSNL